MLTRPAPTAEGNLAKTPFAHVLLYMRERALTGSLVIQAPEGTPILAGESTLVFDKGGVTQVALPSVIAPLGNILLDQGAISLEQLHESLTRLSGGEGLQGEILVWLGACGKPAIETALREQLRRKSLPLFAIKQAPYQYFDHFDLLNGYGGERVREDVFAILWRGVKTHSDAQVVDGVLNKARTHTFRMRANMPELPLFEFDRSTEPVLTALRSTPQPLSRLLELGHDRENSRLLLYVLLITKQIEAMPVSSSHTMPATPAPPLRPTPMSMRPPSGVRSSIPPPRSMTPPVRNSIAPGAPSRPPSDLPKFPSVPPEFAEKKLEADQRLAAMEDQNYFEMLNLPLTATNDTVRAAFLERAGQWHPDRAPHSVPALVDVHQKIFAYLSQAQEALGDLVSRDKYLNSIKDGGGTPNSQKRVAAMIDAATDIQKAEVCLRRRDFDEAERLIKHAMQISPDDPNALVLLAALLVERKPEGPFDEAMVYLTKVSRLAPKHDRAHFLLGTIYKRRGDANRATEFFRRALTANPKNVEAAREVRLAEMRLRSGSVSIPAVKPTTEEKPREGLISKFLKR